MKKRELDKLTKAFQPAAIEIIESPPSPLGKFTIWMIFLILTSAIVWACIGTTEQIVTARGKVIPHGQIKTLQTAEQGIITNILVEEGDHVKEGQVLLEMDSTMGDIDQKAIESRLQVARIEERLLEAELGLADEDLTDILSGADAGAQHSLISLRKQEAATYQQKRVVLSSELEKAKQLKHEARIAAEQSQRQLEMLRDQEAKLKTLLEAGSISKNEWQDKHNECELVEKQLEGAVAREKTSSEEINRLMESLTSLDEEYHSSLYTQLVQKEKEVSELAMTLEKAQKANTFYQLKAPVSGKVSGIGAHTIGAVLQPAQTVVTIVPDGTPLVIEASILNKDIGMIEEGHKVDLKIDAFPFQKHGTIDGTIEYISADAFEHEQLGYIYKVRVRPETEYIQLNKRDVRITAGMTTSMDVKLEERRLIEFFLPAVDYVKDAMKIR